MFVLVAVTLAFGWILFPFYGTILWGLIIALLFTPLYRRLLPGLNGRRTPAALLTLLIVLGAGHCHSSSGVDHGIAGP